jgi:hypothetical protein
MFPWSSPIPMFSDTQPLAFVFAVIYLIANVKSISIFLIPAFIMLIGAIFSFIVSGFSDGIRGIFGYLSIIIVSSAILHHFKYHGMPSYNFYRMVIILWGIVGISQFWFPSIVSFLSSRDGIYALTGGRGVQSFAPEPTFYAIFLLLVAFAIFIQSKNENFANSRQIKVLYLFIFIQIILLSKSSLVLLMLIGSLALYFIIIKPVFLFCLIFLFAAPSIYLFTIVFDAYGDGMIESFRLLRILVQLKNVDIADILSIDGSVSDRAVQIIGSHYLAVIDNLLLPKGFSSWSLQVDSLPSFLIGSFNSIEGLNRILSFSGSLLYEVGIFSIPFLFVFVYLIVKASPGNGFRSVFIKVMIAVGFFLQAIPVGLPTIAFVFAILIFEVRLIKGHTSRYA